MSADAAGTWRRLHPITIVRELLGVAWNVIVAVIVLGALQGDTLARIEVLVPLVFFGVAVGRYYSTRYLLTPDAVLWRRGILFRRRLEVPRSRIQNVSAGADVLGRIFGLRTVTISTAGSEGEIELALVSSEEASFLMADLLGRTVPDGATPAPGPGDPGLAGGPPPPAAGDRWPDPGGAVDGSALSAGPDGRAAQPGPDGRAAQPGPDGRAVTAEGGASPASPLPPGPHAPPASGAPPDRGASPRPGASLPARAAIPPPPPSRRLVTLPVRDLVLYVFTGGGAVVLVLGTIAVVTLAVVTGDLQPLLILVFTAAAPVLSTLDLVDFELTAETDRLRVRHGLLRTRDKWARRERIQVLEVARPVLRSRLGFETISIHTADATIGSADLSLSSPMAPRGQWPEMAGELLEAPSLREADLNPISPRAELRRFLRLLAAMVVPSGVVVVVLAITTDWWLTIGAAVVLLGAALVIARGLARRAQRLDGFAFDDQHLLVRRGMVASRLWLVRRAKVQSVVVTATPFQRRLRLASVLIDTANVKGRVLVVPDLPVDQAYALTSELVELADKVFLPDGV